MRGLWGFWGFVGGRVYGLLGHDHDVRPGALCVYKVFRVQRASAAFGGFWNLGSGVWGSRQTQTLKPALDLEPWRPFEDV